jgi:hypothetical protein
MSPIGTSMQVSWNGIFIWDRIPGAVTFQPWITYVPRSVA